MHHCNATTEEKNIHTQTDERKNIFNFMELSSWLRFFSLISLFVILFILLVSGLVVAVVLAGGRTRW